MRGRRPLNPSHMHGENGEHFEILDSWRGVCAIGVALGHAVIVSHIFEALLFGNVWLFVDFFFVLSGFVISHAYFGKLTSFRSMRVFIIRRFGRLWPLHMTLLAFLVSWEAVKTIMVSALHIAALPSDLLRDPRQTLDSILANTALVQGIGWNSLLPPPTNGTLPAGASVSNSGPISFSH